MDRVVVCPYCDASLPQPEQLGLTYLCSCGAVFALFSENDLGSGLAEMVGGLFGESDQPLGRLMEQCKVTVYQGYDTPVGPTVSPALAGFVKEINFRGRSDKTVNLVWVARENPNPDVDPFVQIQN